MFFKKSNIKRLAMSKAEAELSKSSGIVLIDVRTQEEYRNGHIPGSINIPLDNAEEIKRLVPDLSARLFVYCLSGGRAGAASGVFEDMGYTDITNIGGISSYSGITERGAFI